MTYDEEKEAQEILNQQCRRGLLRAEQARQQLRQEMAADAEAERQAVAPTVPTMPETLNLSQPVKWLNGAIVPQSLVPEQPSRATIEYQQRLEMNKRALQKK